MRSRSARSSVDRRNRRRRELTSPRGAGFVRPQTYEDSMETVDLACEKREVRPKGLVNRIRREGRVPAVIYGNHGSAVAVAVGGLELKARVSTASRQRIMRLKSESP